MHLRHIVCLCALLGATALVAADINPDFSTPAMQKLRDDCATQRVEIAKQRTDALHKLLETQISDTRQTLAKAKVSGNIAGTASATSALRLFTETLAAFEKTGSCAITNSVRRDLEATVELFTRNVQTIEDKRTMALKALDRKFGEQLAEVLAQQKQPAPTDEQRATFLALLMSTSPAVAPAPGTDAAANHAPPVAPPAVLGSMGTAAHWAPLVKLEIVINDAVEILSVPLTGLTSARTLTGTGGMGNDWRIHATPFQELTPRDQPPPFRAESLPPLRPADVLEWPSAKNNWTIELRARADSVPSRHGIVIETEAGACKPIAGAPSLTGAPAPATAGTLAPTGTPVNVRFESVPAGAYVLLNGRPLTAEENKSLLTPFDCLVPAGVADVRFRKRGYQDFLAGPTLLRPDLAVRVKLVDKVGYGERTLTVSAVGPEWTPSGIKVRKGQHVYVAARGTWSCTTDGEAVDADGYPNDNRYFKYYTDPKQNPRLCKDANYGALIARVLPSGDPVNAGKQSEFQAQTDGEIAFSINEAVQAQGDNRGQLTVRVFVDP